MVVINTDLNSNKYSLEWAIQSTYFQQKGYYSWMASKIKKDSNIIEVGSGCGLGTLELIKSGHKIICIESNPDCALATVKTLSNHKIKSVQVNTVAEALIESSNGNVPILLVDVLKITENQWQELAENMNCILCWLFGTYPADIARNGFSAPDKFREKIEENLINVFKTKFSGSQLNFVNRAACNKNMISPVVGQNYSESTYYSMVYTQLFQGIAVTSNQPLGKDDVTCLVSRNIYN